MAGLPEQMLGAQFIVVWAVQVPAAVHVEAEVKVVPLHEEAVQTVPVFTTQAPAEHAPVRQTPSSPCVIGQSPGEEPVMGVHVPNVLGRLQA